MDIIDYINMCDKEDQSISAFCICDTDPIVLKIRRLIMPLATPIGQQANALHPALIPIPYMDPSQTKRTDEFHSSYPTTSNGGAPSAPKKTTSAAPPRTQTSAAAVPAE